MSNSDCSDEYILTEDEAVKEILVALRYACFRVAASFNAMHYVDDLIQELWVTHGQRLLEPTRRLGQPALKFNFLCGEAARVMRKECNATNNGHPSFDVDKLKHITDDQ